MQQTNPNSTTTNKIHPQMIAMNQTNAKTTLKITNTQTIGIEQIKHNSTTSTTNTKSTPKIIIIFVINNNNNK